MRLTGAVRRARNDHRGFTLVEMLIAIAIIGLLMVPLSAFILLTFGQASSISDGVVSARSMARVNASFKRDVESSFWIRRSGGVTDCTGPGRPEDGIGRYGPRGELLAGAPAPIVEMFSQSDPPDPTGFDSWTRTVLTMVPKNRQAYNDALTAGNVAAYKGKFQLWRRQCKKTTLNASDATLLVDDLPNDSSVTIACKPLVNPSQNCTEGSVHYRGQQDYRAEWQLVVSTGAKQAIQKTILATGTQKAPMLADPHFRIFSPTYSLNGTQRVATFTADYYEGDQRYDATSSGFTTIKWKSYSLNYDGTAQLVCKWNSAGTGLDVAASSVGCPTNPTGPWPVSPIATDSANYHAITIAAEDTQGNVSAGAYDWLQAPTPPVAVITVGAVGQAGPSANVEVRAGDSVGSYVTPYSYDPDGGISDILWEVRISGDTTPLDTSTAAARALNCSTSGAFPTPASGRPVCYAGGPATQSIPTTQSGTYEVALTLTDNDGLRGQKATSFVVNGNNPPVAVISYTGTPSSTTNTQFYSTQTASPYAYVSPGSRDPDVGDSITRATWYVWKNSTVVACWDADYSVVGSFPTNRPAPPFAAGVTKCNSETNNPNILFPTANSTYSVVLSVFDTKGAIGVAARDIEVGNKRPIAAPAIAAGSTTVQFYDGYKNGVTGASGSYDPDNTATSPTAPNAWITRVQWNFGDGTAVSTSPDRSASPGYSTHPTGTGNGYNPTHSYTGTPPNGSYWVATLTVWDNYGTASLPVEVFVKAPSISLASNKSDVIAPEEIKFTTTSSTNKSDGGFTNFEWSFGNGSSDSGVSRTTYDKTYANSCDPCTVTVTATDNYGLKAVATKAINVRSLVAPSGFSDYPLLNGDRGGIGWLPWGYAGNLFYKWNNPPGTDSTISYQINVTWTWSLNFFCAFSDTTGTAPSSGVGGDQQRTSIRATAIFGAIDGKVCSGAAYNAKIRTVKTKPDGSKVYSAWSGTVSFTVWSLDSGQAPF